MQTTPTLYDINRQINEALQGFANEHGKHWKKILIEDYWPRCQPAGILINLRNSTHGFDTVRKSTIKPQ